MTLKKASQVKPMTVWCLLAVVLVLSFIAIGAGLFLTPGQGQPVPSKAAPPTLTH